jgi:putative transcription antitermination factor YqgF
MGLAVADGATGVASPLAVVAYPGVAEAARVIAAAAIDNRAALVVVGLPGFADGSESPAARRSRRLAEALGDLGLEVALQSEYLSTVEARARARDAGRRPGLPVDDLAAQVILEEFLERLAAAGRGV